MSTYSYWLCSKCRAAEVAGAISKSQQSIPLLEIDFIDESFSQSFAGFFDLDVHELSAHKRHSHEADVSYNIEHITDVKNVVPDWEDDEVDEIVIMSAKPTTRLPTIPEDIQEQEYELPPTVTLSSFDRIAKTEQSQEVCKKRDTGELFVLKRFPSKKRPVTREQRVLEVIGKLHAPFLQSTYWSFSDKDDIFFIMDFAPSSMAKFIQQYGTLSSGEALLYAGEIAHALATIHSKSVVYLDLNPDSICIDKHGHVILNDFQSAVILDDQPSNPEFPFDSDSRQYGYCSPEVLLRWSIDCATDWWAFGGMLYFMLFRLHPFTTARGGSRQEDVKHRVLHDCILFPPHKPDPTAQDLITKCLERNPSMRLKVGGILEHLYFSSLDWRSLEYKETRNACRSPPCALFSNHPSLNQTILPRKSLDDASSLFSLEARKTVQSVLPKIFQITSGLEVENNADSRTKPTPDRMALFWESLEHDPDFELEPVSAPPMMDYATAVALSIPSKKLRKQRSQSTLFRSRSFSLLGDTPNKLRRRMRRSSTPNLSKKSSYSQMQTLVELPTGVEQIGSGIGYTIPAASRSRVSVCTATPRNCHGGFRHGLGLNLKIGSGILKSKSKTDLKASVLSTENALSSSSCSLLPTDLSPTVNNDSPLTSSDATVLDSPWPENAPNHSQSLGGLLMVAGLDGNHGPSTLRLVSGPSVSVQGSV